MKKFWVEVEFDEVGCEIARENIAPLVRCNKHIHIHKGNARSSLKSAWIATEKYYNWFTGMKGHFRIICVGEVIE